MRLKVAGSVMRVRVSNRTGPATRQKRTQSARKFASYSPLPGQPASTLFRFSFDRHQVHLIQTKFMSKDEENFVNKDEENFLTVAQLKGHLERYGPQAGVFAYEGVIVFLDTEEGGTELGRIETPGA